MVQSAYQSVLLQNGETVRINDHVYASLPWSERDGSPYLICRILDLLPPNSTPKKGGSKNRPSKDPLVRLSIYFRPSDISRRNVTDSRLILGAIHTDIQPVSSIRGKCYVRHKDRIDDLLRWKKLPDHFYFTKYYDPYIQKEFEVIRTEAVNNVPLQVKEVLRERYEFILTEREMLADLMDTFKSCCVCDQWASNQDAVRCEACKKHYHMNCLKPPLAAKPAKGYSWVCLTCSLQRHKDVEDQKYLFTAATSAPKANKANGKARDKVVDASARPDVSYRGWPWRYFGLYTRALDVLDPDDAIFPRAATRVGKNYQANVLSWEEQREAEAKHGILDNEAGPSRHIAVERGYDTTENNHESTIDVWSMPSEELSLYMRQVSQLPLPVPAYDVERLDKAIILYTTSGSEKAMNALRHLRLVDFTPIFFTEHETIIFEEELEKTGGLDTYETAKVLSKRPAEVLRYSYIWKNKKLKAENEALRQHHKVNTAHARQNKTLGAPSLGRIRSSKDKDSNASEADDEVSLFGDEIKGTKRAVCAACSTRISSVWWRAPRHLPGEAMCENCGSNYRKYGVISFTKAEDSKKPDKKEPANKKAKTDGSGASTPMPAPVPKLPPCAFCRKMEPKAAMARCKTCTFSVHSGCYGIPPMATGTEWECELCTNVREEEACLQPHCVLCPKDFSALKAQIKKRPPVDFDILSCLKPTEGSQWAHILCSIWAGGEVVYTHPEQFKAVEGITTIAREKWEEQCTLCAQVEGAVIGCSDCGVLYHPACAWLVGHKMGFEFSLAKPGRRELPIIAKFKEETGVMMPGVWCKGHDLEGRQIYDMHDTDPEQNETALQIYTGLYKHLPLDESFALLRKATRLDQYIKAPKVLPRSEVLKHCSDCGIDVSPRWYTVPGDVGVDSMDIDGEGKGVKEKRVCHQCWFKIT